MRKILLVFLVCCLGAAPFRPRPCKTTLNSSIKGPITFRCRSEVYRDGHLYKYVYRFSCDGKHPIVLGWWLFDFPNLPGPRVLITMEPGKEYTYVVISKESPGELLMMATIYEKRHSKKLGTTYHYRVMKDITNLWHPNGDK